MTKKKLKDALANGEFVAAPGVYDMIAASPNAEDIVEGAEGASPESALADSETERTDISTL